MLRAVLHAAVLLFVAHQALVPMAETDLFFHLELGDLIRSTGRIPFQNLFSFTFPEHVDPDLAWAFQVAVSLAHGAAGFPGVVLLKALLIVAAAALCHRTCRRGGAGPLAAAAATVLAVAAANQRLVERPHLVTFVGLAALGLLLREAETQPRLVWGVPALVWVWANFHAGVFLASVVLIGYAIGARLDRTPLPGGPRRFAAALALSAAASFATPAGPMLPRYLLWHTGLGATRNIEEFRRADPWDDPWFFLVVTICLVTLVRLGRRARFRQALPALVIAALAWRSVRFAAECAFVAAPVVATGFAALGAGIGERTRRGAMALGAAALIVFVVEGRVGRPLHLDLAPDVVPFRAIAFATKNGLRERMFHDLDVGCYLLWEGWPRYRVFEDARLPAYPDAFHRQMDETPLDPAPFDALLRRYGVDAALINYPEVNVRSGSFDPEEWALVYRAADAMLFARRIPRHAGVIARHELPLRIRFAFDGGSRAEGISAPPSRSPVPRCEWTRRLAVALEGEALPERALDARATALSQGCLSGTEEAEVRFRLGARLQLAGQLTAAATFYDRALALAPDHVGALVNRGFARLRSDPAAARADFVRALALAPTRADARAALAQLPAR